MFRKCLCIMAMLSALEIGCYKCYVSSLMKYHVLSNEREIVNCFVYFKLTMCSLNTKHAYI